LELVAFIFLREGRVRNGFLVKGRGEGLPSCEAEELFGQVYGAGHIQPITGHGDFPYFGGMGMYSDIQPCEALAGLVGGKVQAGESPQVSQRNLETPRRCASRVVDLRVVGDGSGGVNLLNQGGGGFGGPGHLIGVGAAHKTVSTFGVEMEPTGRAPNPRRRKVSRFQKDLPGLVRDRCAKAP